MQAISLFKTNSKVKSFRAPRKTPEPIHIRPDPKPKANLLRRDTQGVNRRRHLIEADEMTISQSSMDFDPAIEDEFKGRMT